MGADGTGEAPDATRSLPSPVRDDSGKHTAATALLSEPAPPSPIPSLTGTPTDATPVATLAPGDRLGRFSVLGTLGSGGMGVVYAAYDPELDRRVAIKLLAQGKDRGREASLRLLREAQAMARLSHPHV